MRRNARRSLAEFGRRLSGHPRHQNIPLHILLTHSLHGRIPLDDSQLLALSLALSAIGLVLLFLLSNSLQPSPVAPWQISGAEVGKTVLVKGTINGFYKTSSFASFSLCSSGCIKVTDFASNSRLQNGRRASVEGTVREYKGELGITASVIEVTG